VTLGQVADVEVTRGTEKINREQGQRRIVVMSNVRGRDLGSFVAEVQQKANNNVRLPARPVSLPRSLALLLYEMEYRGIL
jgi:heavy metal efflux system protein